MHGVGGADKPIIGGVEHIPVAAHFGGHLVHEGLRGHAGLFGLLLDLLAVLVGARLKEHIVAVLPLIAGDGVGQHDLIGVAHMGFARGVGDGRGQIVLSFAVHFLSSMAPLLLPANEPARRI